MSEHFIMRPGDTFTANECGCSFTVESGPTDESMAAQAPRCCCGHEMHKQDSKGQSGDTKTDQNSSGGMSTPQMMRD